MAHMKKNGFTLIELVVVIVILGILAVVAAPKFMNLQVDARNAALKGLEGALKSALGVGYSKLAIAGLENNRYVTNRKKLPDESDNFTFLAKFPLPGCKKDNPCTFYYGYPEATETTFQQLMTNLDSEWIMIRDNGKLDFTFRQFSKKSTTPDSNGKFPTIRDRDNCYIEYTPPTSATSGYTLKLIKCS